VSRWRLLRFGWQGAAVREVPPRVCLQSPLGVVWDGWSDSLPGGVASQPSAANGSGSGLANTPYAAIGTC
jgi:hypothetical protein